MLFAVKLKKCDTITQAILWVRVLEKAGLF